MNGVTIGNVSSASSTARPRKLPRCRPSAAAVPSVVATSMVRVATIRLLRVAITQRSLPKKSSYQRSEKRVAGSLMELGRREGEPERRQHRRDQEGEHQGCDGAHQARAPIGVPPVSTRISASAAPAIGKQIGGERCGHAPVHVAVEELCDNQATS